MFVKVERPHKVYENGLIKSFDCVYYKKTKSGKELYYWELNGGLIPLHDKIDYLSDIPHIRELKLQLFGKLPSDD